jgi:intergrase/recombinase
MPNKVNMKEHNINSLDDFICGWYLDDTTICDEIITYHKSNPLIKGNVGAGYLPDIKDSFDCPINDDLILKKYYHNLTLCSHEYIKKFEYCDYYAPWGVVERVNIQKYEPNGAFYAWHTERITDKYPTSSRHLVFMTYLNDVIDGGETEFFHQKIKVKPEKGLTLIWPADWTFTHRGIPSPTQEKYIVTGWFSFVS